MGINVVIDEKLVEEVRTITGLTDSNAAIEHLLRRVLLGRRKHKDLLDLVGKIDFYEGYDPKSLRS